MDPIRSYGLFAEKMDPLNEDDGLAGWGPPLTTLRDHADDVDVELVAAPVLEEASPILADEEHWRQRP